MKKQSNVKLIITIVVAVAVAIALIILIPFNYARIFKYNAKAPAETKFEKISKWIPNDAELEVVFDLPKILEDASLKDLISKSIGGGNNVTSELASTLLARHDVIGMLAIIGKINDVGQAPEFAAIAQGQFDEKTMIPAIRSSLAVGKSGLVSEKSGNNTIYTESDERDPFGFIVLDERHIAVGNRSSLIALFKDAPFEKTQPKTLPQSVIFGHLRFGPRLTALLPKGMSAITSIDFESKDGLIITAKIPVVDAAQAKDLKMFLEGVRSLLLFQSGKNSAIFTILGSVSINEVEGGVIVTANTVSMLGNPK